MDKVNILGVHVDMVNISQATDCIMRFLDEDKFHAVYTPNSEIIMLAYKDEKFCKLLNNADLLTADGIGVVHASKILKKPISERAAGYDIARQVLQKMNYTNHKLFLFGGKPGVAEEAKKKLLEEYTDLNIVGTRNGYFKPEEEAEIVEEINNSGADTRGSPDFGAHCPRTHRRRFPAAPPIPPGWRRWRSPPGRGCWHGAPPGRRDFSFLPSYDRS